MTGFCFFQTEIGACGLAWREQGLVRVMLPEADGSAALTALRRRFPDLAEAEPPAYVQEAIERIKALMAGQRIDLSDIDLDLETVSAFDRRVYAVARAIPPGEVLTYGEIAERLGDKLLAREVGQSMGRNPWPIVVPCHRVLGAGGKMTGFSAPGGVNTKERMLAIEGYFPGGQPSLFG
ncbi:methylated-DNA--[protein]-cysteine S-methyltransferase [Phenylobacterium montanum]|uniref:methylated-DNA--[protein]-cysteine S-methyltransferase n=2 Tax=Phenylobacterium montanum TaxID=2823693 RepID=A0A975G4B0_9CAUL|nr:methylated-DNA--[protein]-cysteine S-methyltransferase [Caulobacter sp. S6]